MHCVPVFYACSSFLNMVYNVEINTRTSELVCNDAAPSQGKNVKTCSSGQSLRGEGRDSLASCGEKM